MNEELNSDSTEALLEEYDNRRKSRLDDVIAMQTFLCLCIVVGFIILNYFCPDTAEMLLSEIKEKSSDSHALIPNPIDYFITLFK
ncbi:MAG: hypothetical protein MJ081_05665 [Ruminococcus sp.]|nr:hypothetical protein [Ruminococcus sp.]